jgi:ABC-2 type transport system ATP-binding protein
MAIIHIQNLIKEFRILKPNAGKFGLLHSLFRPEYMIRRAVNNISLDINEGEIIGYVGANGAGKSTTIKMLTGILQPTSGIIEVAGFDPWKQRRDNARNIGVVFGQRSHLWWDLPLIESFKLVARIYGISEFMYQRNLKYFTDLLDMESFINTPVRQLSLGQRMRGDLVAAMLYEPRILYLDEPTIGLDVFARERIRSFIEEVNRSTGLTVILTTHDLNDVERLCPRIIMIDQGSVIYDGLVATLKKNFTKKNMLVVHFEDEPANLQIPNAQLVRYQGKKVWLEYDPQIVSAASLISDVSQQYPIVDLSVTEPELEAVIREIYEERQNEK